MRKGCAVITGATGGIGRWIALGLVDAGYRLFIIGRDPGRLDRTVEWISNRIGDRPRAIEPIQADLSLLAETRAAAEIVLSRTDTLALLVNNAGVLSPLRVVTSEGHEQTLAVNHLSPFVLTRQLLPALRRQAAIGPRAVRIVDVGSSMSDRARIDPDNLQLTRNWGMVRAYSQSKLALLTTSLALADQLDGSRIRVNVVHPGRVATGLVRNPGVIGLVWRLQAPSALTERQGAETPLHAALSPEFESLSGAYVKRCKPVAPNPRALDPRLRARVLQATEAFAAADLPAAS